MLKLCGSKDFILGMNLVDQTYKIFFGKRYLLCKPVSFTGSEVCMTVSGASPNKTCIFPFIFRETTYNECAWEQESIIAY
jgi:hypothetical protein